MPRYEYKCTECLGVFTVRHLIKETINVCKGCGSEGSVEKIPTSFLTVKQQKAGKVVRQHIEETKQDLRQEKQDLQNREYRE
jgi:putative FmdB family regulatory protein